ncbi:hypothetical protein CEJ39_17155 [Rhodococcus pyridinivorans]|uniref:HNH endonuclease n=1 Tax=Rhodococcus pyridinivorans TaxID=103816 RepID=UPI000DCACDB6|nr:HNH endonuclease [Rhodococcus pyridinivorans]AWZ25663.1 hypothetical protein CEJ39_17155 [Rhodococcus pyridinivorans]
MARATARVCCEPGCPTIIRGATRCPEHQRARDAHQRATVPTKATYNYAELKRRRATVDAWRQQHGDWCPGYQRPPHHSTQLSADHITPVALGGAQDGPLGVLCISCNARKGNRVQHGHDPRGTPGRP